MFRHLLLAAILLTLIQPAVAQPGQPKSGALIPGPQQPMSTTQTQASRPPLPTPWRGEESNTLTIARQDGAQLSALVERRVINTLGKTPEAGLIISNVVYSGDWAFGAIAIPPGPGGDAPDFDLFIARREGDQWSVALTGEPRFEQWREEAPEDLPIMRSTRVAGQSATGNGSARLRLPWTVGETWTLTGGPHHNLGYDENDRPIVDRPWSSLDFDGGSRIVRPARIGIAYRPCADFVVIDHGDGWYTGYYHLDRIGVSHGQRITDDQLNTVVLGHASTRVGCGGSARGAHLHFSLRYGSAGGFVNIHGHAIGGWTVEEGSAPYQGCMVRNGNRQCAGWGRIHNDGRVGDDSGGGNNRPPNTPSPVSPGDWHVARDGRAPTLCWNNPGDPDGDSVTFFAEVFESAVNAQSGWTSETCWRPASLDGRAFNYQWRVRARDSRGAESGWSTVWHFSIENPPPPPNNNWQAQYWDNRELRGSPRVSTSEGGIYLVRHWGWGGGPHGLPGDEWSARFVKTLYFPGGDYRFHCQHDDGCRLYINGQLRIDHWWDSSFGGADWGGYLPAGNHEIKVEYYEKSGEAALEVWWQGPGFLPRDESCDYNNGWCAEYYLNRDVRGTAAIRRGEGQSLALDWGSGSPGPTFPGDNFSSRFMRRAHFTCGTYRFNFFTDDGIRFWANDALRLDQWRDQVASYSVDLNLNTGHHTLRVEHYENGGGAAIRAWWEKLADCPPTVAIDHVSTHYARPGASVDPTVRARVTSGYLDGGRGDALTFVGGAALGAAANQPLYGFVHEGNAYTFDVANSGNFRMTAPASEGIHESHWQVRAAGGLVGPVATVRVMVDNTPPVVAIQSPGDGAYINGNLITLQAAPQDANGVDQAQFFAGYDDGSGWAWRNLGWDTDGTDGWQITWNASAVPDQVGVALYAYAWDLAGNGAGAARWDITLDRTPPSVAIQPLPANQDSTAFIVWWNGAPDTSGISRYDLQIQDNDGPWQDWLQNVGPQYGGAWFIGALGHRYAFRIRATDRAGNVSAYSSPVETFVQICSPDAYEPDNERSAAQALPSGQPQARTFCGAGDHDWVKFRAAPGQRFVIYTAALDWATDTVLTLFDPAGNVLAENDDVDYPNDLSSRIEFAWTAAYTGTLYARVRHYDSRIAGDGVTYRLLFAPMRTLYLPVAHRN